MGNSGLLGIGFVVVLFWLAVIVFLIVLFVAPIKLYSIHREIKATNDLLRAHLGLLATMEGHNRAQVTLLANLANLANMQASMQANLAQQRTSGNGPQTLQSGPQ